MQKYLKKLNVSNVEAKKEANSNVDIWNAQNKSKPISCAC